MSEDKKKSEDKRLVTATSLMELLESAIDLWVTEADLGHRQTFGLTVLTLSLQLLSTNPKNNEISGILQKKYEIVSFQVNSSTTVFQAELYERSLIKNSLLVDGTVSQTIMILHSLGFISDKLAKLKGKHPMGLYSKNIKREKWVRKEEETEKKEKKEGEKSEKKVRE